VRSGNGLQRLRHIAMRCRLFTDIADFCFAQVGDPISYSEAANGALTLPSIAIVVVGHCCSLLFNNALLGVAMLRA